MTSPTLLLSGFGPFPGVPENPTERLVRAFAERTPPAGVGRLATVLLPTEFGGAAARLVAAIEAEQPEAVVMLGVAGPGAIRLERLARNTSRPRRPDAAGRYQGPGAILPDAPPSWPSTLPLGACHRALATQGLPVAWSDDAGGYVCDDLFFRTRHHLERTGATIPCGFVHVPPAAQTDDAGHMSLAAMTRAVEAILATIAQRLAAPSAWRVEADPAGFADWLGLLALIRRAFAPMEGRIDPPSSAQALTPEGLADRAQLERLLLVRDGEGRALACAFLRTDRAAAYLGKIAVEPALQGRGLARALVAAAEGLAAGAGCAALELQSRVELVENHGVFGALGFAKVGETTHAGYRRPTSVTFRKTIAATAPALE